MQKMTMDEASRSSLSEAVKLVCGSHEALVIAGPDGEVARLVPISKTTPHGRPIRDKAETKAMTFPYTSETDL